MPRARGLFRAVLQSGSLNLTRPPATALDVTRQIMAEVGLSPADAHRLRDVPAKDLMAAANAVAGRSVIPPFSPVADGELIPAGPFAAIAEGSARGVPLIVGTNLEEMKLYRFLDPSLEQLDEAALVQRCAMLFPGAGPDGRPHAERAVDAYRSARRARGEDTSPVETWLAISTDHLFRPAPSSWPSSRRHTPTSSSTSSSGRGSSLAGRRGPFTPSSSVRVRDAGDVRDRRDRRRTPAAETLAGHMQDAWLAFARSGVRAPRASRVAGLLPPAGPR